MKKYLLNPIFIISLLLFSIIIVTLINLIKYFICLGYSPDKYSMWRELCSKTREKLTDPYLRAAFAFLTSETDSHDAVLVIILYI